MIYSEILEEIKKEYSDIQKYGFSSGYVSSLGEVEISDTSKGSGDKDWYVVFYYKEHDVYVKVSAYYESYYGVSFDEDWEGISEVRPSQKVVTIYS